MYTGRDCFNVAALVVVRLAVGRWLRVRSVHRHFPNRQEQKQKHQPELQHETGNSKYKQIGKVKLRDSCTQKWHRPRLCLPDQPRAHGAGRRGAGIRSSELQIDDTPNGALHRWTHIKRLVVNVSKAIEARLSTSKILHQESSTSNPTTHQTHHVCTEDEAYL
jgi:hypothetical protein